MTDRDKAERERDKADAREVLDIIKDARREGLFNNLIGVALSGYINGVNDACRCMKAAQTG